MIRRPPRSTPKPSSAASDVYKRQHVIRLTNLLKLVSSRDPVKIERQVTSMVPPEEWTGLSLRLILHGRRVCIARRPRCEECVLNDFCPSSCTRPKARKKT